MKIIKLILTCMVFALGTNIGFIANAQETPIEQKNTYKILFGKRGTLTRDIINIPDASITYDILSISFDDTGIYDLYIYNEYGECIYYATLPANGMIYTFDVSAIREEGLYTVIIDGNSGTYEGFVIF